MKDHMKRAPISQEMKVLIEAFGSLSWEEKTTVLMEIMKLRGQQRKELDIDPERDARENGESWYEPPDYGIPAEDNTPNYAIDILKKLRVTEAQYNIVKELIDKGGYNLYSTMFIRMPDASLAEVDYWGQVVWKDVRK